MMYQLHPHSPISMAAGRPKRVPGASADVQAEEFFIGYFGFGFFLAISLFLSQIPTAAIISLLS